MNALRCVAIALVSFALAAPAVAASASRTRLMAQPGSSKAGLAVKLVAEVDGLGGGAPTGTVSFSEGGVALGAGTLSAYGAGQATLTSTCALTSVGGVMCWGHNEFGAVGDGTTTDRPSPVAVSGLSGGVVAITTGAWHSCALTVAGAVLCWGWNYYGQIGDGTMADRPTPVAVSGLSSGVVAIAAGKFHTCALTSAGAVLCWGYDAHGQLGDGAKYYIVRRLTPVGARGLSSGVVSIAAGGNHSCAVMRNGAARCWGQNDRGQLGDGTRTGRRTPVAVTGLAGGVAAIVAGTLHTCAVTSSHAVKCWGYNHYGQIGDGTTTTRITPVAVSGLSSGVVALAAGSYHNCALKGGGGLWCWGRNYFGQLGDRTTTDRATPVSVPGHTRGVLAIALDGDHSCVSVGSGVVRCWGSNWHGELGDGTFKHRRAPAPIPGFTALIRARASMLTNSLAVGSHMLQASFPGDAAHTPSSGTQSHMIVP
jgi:alpha-tubulin suppressor-like RCC1 family protein